VLASATALGEAADGADKVTPFGTGADAPPAPAPDPTAAAAPKERPDWLVERMRAGQEFDKQRAPYYEERGGANEVAVGEKTEGGGQNRLDSYIPGEEIVSRKNSQLAEVQPGTAKEYLSEIDQKYAPGIPIANTPGNQEKLGGDQTGNVLRGEKILEVPVQNVPIPQDILKAAEDREIIIRDVQGKEYTLDE
jgi:hypothetical protein